MNKKRNVGRDSEKYDKDKDKEMERNKNTGDNH
jgi:hypothetical protein